MSWSDFSYFAWPAIVLWMVSAALVWGKRTRTAAGVSMIAGAVVFATFIALLWIEGGRPPMRTMGETRLWYSFFLSMVGFAGYLRTGYRWLLAFAAAMATMFAIINLAKPEIHSAGLMPALQSAWFVPHVTVYMLSYAMMAAAAVGACVQLRRIAATGFDQRIAQFTDSVVRFGFGLLTFGMLMGMVWAEIAWGGFWSWDPKETWALATCLACLVYIHLRLRGIWPRFTQWMLVVAFVLLMVTWIGVKYLPAASGSVHIY